MARQRGPQRRVRGGTAHVAMGRQDLRGALARDDRAEDAHPGRTRDVGHGMVQLQIHLHQRLLHVLNVRGRVLDEPLAQPQIGAQLDDRLAWTEAAAQQPVLVQLLEPLRVVDVRLPPRHLLDVARIDQHDLEAAGLEDLEDGNPVHARGLHRDGRDADGVQPVGERVQVATEGAERPDRRRVTVRATATTWYVAPISMPAACGLIVENGFDARRFGRCAIALLLGMLPRQGWRTRTLS